MAGFSDYLIKKLLDRQYSSTAFASPSLYFALMTTAPNKDGSGGAEVDLDLSGYSRAQVTNSSSEWPAATGTGIKSNANAITFGLPGDPWGDITAIAIYDAQARMGDPFTVNAGTDVITEAGHGYVDGDVLLLASTGTLPGNLPSNTPVYVRDKTTDTYKLALTAAGAAIDITTSGSGTHTARLVGNLLAMCSISTTSIPTGVRFSIPAGALQLTLSGCSNYLNCRTLDYLFGAQTFTVPGTLYQALFTTAPDGAGAGAVEPTGNAYARKSVTNNSTEFPLSTLASGLKANANAQTFATPTPSGWGTVVAVGLYDAATGGNLWWSDTVSDTVVAASDPFVIAAADMRILLT
jgi:hypothetical protein